jgi:diguanylate cyclase (GGDEF)-like protein
MSSLESQNTVATTDAGRKILDDMHPVLFLNSEGVIVWANRPVEQFLSVASGTLCGRSFNTLVVLNDDKRQQPAQKLGATAFTQQNGAAAWGQVRREAFGELTIVFITPCDLLATDLNRLHYQESIWRNAVESADHGVWDYNAVGDARYHSAGWKRLRSIPDHIPPYETYGAWIARIHPDDRDFVEEQIRLHNSGEVKQFRFEYREKDYNGNYVWVLSCGQSLEFDADGVPTRLVGVDVDITAIKEEEIRRRDDMARLHTEHLRQVEIEHSKTESARQEAHSLSRQDPLTMLSNRRVFSDEINRLLRHGNGPRCFAILLVDLDRFKPVNDLYGHATGDIIIRASSERLLGMFEPATTISRLGGDEFGVIVEGHPDTIDTVAADAARQIIAGLSEPIEVKGFLIEIGASIGIATCPKHGTDAKALFRNADMALYDVKQAERGRHKFYSESMGRDAQARAVFETEVRQAVVNQDFTPHFQPVICIKTGKVAGFEVLARWNSKALGAVSPDKFISVIDQFNLMPQFTQLILGLACDAAKLWPEHVHFSINLSAREVCDIGTPMRILGKLHEKQVAPRRLKIEITEQALMQDLFTAKQVIAAFRSAGIRVVLDDFGAGHAGLGYLRDLKFDTIKIDRTFVASLLRQQESTKIVTIIQTLAQSLGLETVAEGIEDSKMLDAVKRIGCDYGQGFYFSAAVPASDTTFLFTQFDGLATELALKRA